MNGLKLLSEIKFYNDYSKYNSDIERKLNWLERIGNVMDMHRNNPKFAKAFENEKFVEYFEFAENLYKNKMVLASQRTLQFAGEPIMKHNSRLYNCLHPDTEFVTSEGVKSFKDFKDGDSVKVMTHTGEWKDAIVKNYGKDYVNDIIIKRNNNVFTLKATKNHRWYLKDEHGDPDITENLRIGDKILSAKDTFSEFNYDNASPFEKLYWCYGYVYGDGTKVKDNDVYKYTMVRLCDHDRQYECRFEEMGFSTSKPLSCKGDFMAYTGKYLKTPPDPSIDSPNLIKAFVAGYLDADGCSESRTSNPFSSIQASDIEHINFIRKCFPVAGMYIVSEKELTSEVTNYAERPYTVSFRLLNKFDRENKYAASFNVIDIKSKTELVEVWCLEVEDNRSFVLSNGVVTGNCLTSYCDRPEVFQEAMYWLLSGCGVGVSFVKEHVSKLPSIYRRTLGTKTFIIDDSIEGWADAIGVLISSYVTKDATFPEYCGYEVKFDYSLIRPKGAFISGGFKAPGHEGLKLSLEKIENILERNLNSDITYFKPIVAYDILMFAADAVLSGGVRRSATIALFSPDDNEMMNAKTGNWFVDNPQRARSNNSALLVRNQTPKELFDKLILSTKEFGEPGFVFADSIEVVYNPCVEIGMIPRTIDGRSGWQGCNLCEINGGKMNNVFTFLDACKAAAILGTLQAAYTDFKYVSSVTKEIFDYEALLGVSITGFMSNPKVLLNPETLKEGAELIKKINEEVSQMIGIRKAARTTCVKPSGNASVLLETTSGIHGDHAQRYFRVMQMNKQEEIAKYIAEKYPDLVEESVWSATNADFALFVPVKAKQDSIFKKDLLGVKQLEAVKLVQQTWVEYGTNIEACIEPYLRHNVSNTVSVDNWEEVAEYIWDNQQWFAGISLISHVGDKVYNQAPFTEVLTPTEIIEKYGDSALVVSGLIVDGLHLFENNLWKACDFILNRNMVLDGTRTQVLLKKDWLQRAKKFAKRYFNSTSELVFCMKDVHLFHKWLKTEKIMKNIDIEEILQNTKPDYTDVDTLGAVACSGGVNGSCEITRV